MGFNFENIQFSANRHIGWDNYDLVFELLSRSPGKRCSRDNWIAEVVHHLKRLGCSDDAWNGVERLLVTHELGGNDDGNRFIGGIVDHDRPFAVGIDGIERIVEDVGIAVQRLRAAA